MTTERTIQVKTKTYEHDSQGSDIRVSTSDVDLLEAVYQGEVIDAGFTTDLTAAIAACDALDTSVLQLHAHDYTWPDNTLWPVGMNAVGIGWDAVGAATDGRGTRINQASGNIIQQQTGDARATRVENIFFADGFQNRKHHTAFKSCRFAGDIGLIVGDDSEGASPYYCSYEDCKFMASTDGTCIQLEDEANAVTFHGSLIIPLGGRGIYSTASVEKVGNRFDLSLDYTSLTTTIQSVINLQGTIRQTQINLFYREEGGTMITSDGAHFVFGSSANYNTVRFAGSSSQNLRVLHEGDVLDNIVHNSAAFAKGHTYSNANTYWHLGNADKLFTGTATQVVMPPTWYANGFKQIIPSTFTFTLQPAHFIASVGINAAGSGGTDGTYYVWVTTASDEVNSNHRAIVEIVVVSGAISTVDVKYFGWFDAAGAATWNVTGVTGLTGGILDLTWDADDFVHWDNGDASGSVSASVALLSSCSPVAHPRTDGALNRWYVHSAVTV